MTSKFKLLLLVCAAGSLGACATTNTSGSTFGASVKQNIAVHAVAPTDAQKQNTFIPADRDRKALAKDRYKKDEVEEPTPVNTMQ